MRVCAKSDCVREVYARGLCSRHYQAARRLERHNWIIKKRTVGTGNKAVPQTPLAARLRELREQAGMSRKMVAGALNTFPNRVSDWEIGTNLPRLDTLQRYGELFDCSVSQLLDGVM